MDIRPQLFAKARAEGKSFPFSNHQPNYQVDFSAIPYGAKIAGLIVMDLMGKGASK